MKQKLIFISILIIPIIVFAQYKPIDKPVSLSTALRAPVALAQKSIGLVGLDPDRLNITQSYQMGYTSIGSEGITQATYLNTMTYHFKLPVTLSLQWGISHQPFGPNENLPMMQSGPFVSGARVSYAPTKNMVIDFVYQHIPNGYGYSSYNRFNRFSPFNEW